MRKRRTLLVDDDDDIRMIARIAIERDERYVVVGEAVNGAEGILLAERAQPDVVLLDLEMPWLHGAEAVPLIREVSPRSTIVLWTVAPESSRAAEALALGASALLKKGGFAIGSLPETLSTLLDSLGTAEQPYGGSLAR